MNKRHRKIIEDVVQRWSDTILKTGRGDVDTAKNMLQKIYPKARIATVDTPAQFYIAQAVIRKRVAKKRAKSELCPQLGIAPDFIDDLPMTGGPIPLISGYGWTRRSADTLFDRAWIAHVEHVCTDKITVPGTRRATSELLHGPSRWRRQSNAARENYMLYQTCDIHGLYNHMTVSTNAGYRPEIHGAMSFSQRVVSNSCLSLADAVSGHPYDIVDGRYEHRLHSFDATQAEIMCRTINCKKPEITMFHEIFHLVPAIMRFRDSFLLLTERPQISLNAEGLLHSETGPGVTYSDGRKLWYIDGHLLREQGEKIVMAPDTLTGKEITEIDNEEERRVAIDRMGWEKYLVEINAKVIDTRDNWVDNTVEVLFKVPRSKRRKGIGGIADDSAYRVLLSCRSTGRRYFLGAPMQTETNYWRREKTQPIKNCEDVQKWMANGAYSAYLPYAKHTMQIVGAS